ncbi:histidine kinase [Mucilaginibacter sp. ZT4R22]|uniref:Histidine kinase n=1 Tax=Mucilaginibacter pankratovii TaxID=2772110 RepID=A0ABR7WSL5_9SPHI|nr:histidine kinase [Mucilaginibacter pankratovii]MBD1365306.1 histidine kinase [Mucilaginibacter pankratovii]
MKKKYIILLHVAFWAVFIISNSVPKFLANNFFSYKHTAPDAVLYFKYLLIEFGYTLILISCFYGSYLFIAPQFFVHKRYVQGIVFMILCMALVILLRYALEYGFFLPVLGFDNYMGHPWPAKRYISNIVLYYFPGNFMYGMAYFFAENWYKNNRRHQELQKEKLSTELAFLRSQVNPHFLFNTINDIYALTYQKSDQAPEALLKLSVMLRYMLRDGNEDFMPLNREVEYLENAIALQRIGAKGVAYINFTQEGYIGDQPVASLLFIAFVENAFKHGVLNEPASPVEIYLHADNLGIIFNVRNKKNKGLKDIRGGIGLSNVQRRLQLIYPDRHQLTVSDSADFYEVNLILKQNEWS